MEISLTAPKRDLPNSSQRMTFVDALRGLSAIAVVLVHANGVLYAGSTRPGSMLDGISMHLDILSHGVDVFFVISGFVIAHSIGTSVVNARYAGRFAIRRSIRLDPPYWVAIILTLGVTVLRRHIGHERPRLPSSPQLLSHLLYAQRVLGYENIIIVFWTLCIEVQFYLIFILLLWVGDSISRVARASRLAVRASTIAVVFVGSLIWLLAAADRTADVTAWEKTIWFLPHWPKFLIGAVIWYAWQRVLPKASMWVALLAFALAVLIVRLPPTEGGFKYRHSLWVGLGTATAFAIAINAGGIYRWMHFRPLQFLGRISYPVYLVHVPVISATLGLQKRIAPGSALGSVVFVVGTVALVICVGTLMHVVVEQPSVRLAARFKLKKDDLAGGIEGPGDAPIQGESSLCTASSPT